MEAIKDKIKKGDTVQFEEFEGRIKTLPLMPYVGIVDKIDNDKGIANILVTESPAGVTQIALHNSIVKVKLNDIIAKKLENRRRPRPRVPNCEHKMVFGESFEAFNEEILVAQEDNWHPHSDVIVFKDQIGVMVVKREPFEDDFDLGPGMATFGNDYTVH